MFFHPLAPHRRTADYPSDYERTVTLRDGRRAFVRPVLPEDGPLIESTFGQVATLPRRTTAQPGDSVAVPLAAEEFAIIDYVSEFRMVAYDVDGCLVGTAGYREIADVPWDVATAVTGFCTHPDWRGIGLACEMLGAIALRACESGVEQLCALLGPGDTRTRHLVDRVGGRIVVVDGRGNSLAVALTRRAVTLAAV